MSLQSLNKPVRDLGSNISIITACFNSAETLEQALQSVAAQTSVVEHIVVDGASTDATGEIIKRYRARLGGSVSQRDAGVYDALNKGIQISTAGIIGILHSDDLYANQDVVEQVLEAFADSDIDAIYGDLDYVHRSNSSRVVRHWNAGEYAPGKLYHGWMPPHPTFFVRRECYEKYGLYRLDLGTAADYELMLRFLLVHNIRVKYIPRVLVKMRVGGASNASIKARVIANRMDRKAWQVNGLKPHPWTLLAKPLRKVGQWWIR